MSRGAPTNHNVKQNKDQITCLLWPYNLSLVLLQRTIRSRQDHLYVQLISLIYSTSKPLKQKGFSKQINKKLETCYLKLECYIWQLCPSSNIGQCLIEAQIRTEVDQFASITLASVHFAPYDRLKLWCENFGSSFFSITHLDRLFCVQPWDEFRIF